jgi:hypothetical protein
MMEGRNRGVQGISGELISGKYGAKDNPLGGKAKGKGGKHQYLLPSKFGVDNQGQPKRENHHLASMVSKKQKKNPDPE